MRTRAFVSVMFVGLVMAACGGGGGGSSTIGSSTPTAPSAPAPAANRAPVVNSMTVNPSFGITQLTTFLISASASDADGDAITYRWEFGDGTTGTGSAFSKIYQGTGVATVRVTVEDSKGATATDSRTVTVGGMAGVWVGTMTTSATGQASMALDLTQGGPVVTGLMVLAGFRGRTDPAQPGRIDSGGSIELRMKVDPFSDFTMRGQMDATGRRVTGTVHGSGFNGQPFTMDKQ